MYKYKRHDIQPKLQQGFSLSEVLIAIGLISILSTMLLSNLPNMLKLSRQGQDSMQIVQAAQGYMEHAKANSHALIAGDTSTLQLPSSDGYSCTETLSTIAEDTERMRLFLSCTPTLDASQRYEFVLELAPSY